MSTPAAVCLWNTFLLIIELLQKCCGSFSDFADGLFHICAAFQSAPSSCFLSFLSLVDAELEMAN